jgi:YfiR/HmsC-like
MLPGEFTGGAPARNGMKPCGRNLMRRVFALVTGCAWLLAAGHGFGGETSLTEYQVKSLFLMNFVKYVDWPVQAFADTTSPIVIGLYGEDKFSDALTQAVEGRQVSGRRIIVRTNESGEDAGKCHVLFISASENNHLGEILGKVRTLPVLTVGEAEGFMAQGGVINFVKRDGKVHLEINLTAAHLAGLVISSKLLGVADFVEGKANPRP